MECNLKNKGLCERNDDQGQTFLKLQSSFMLPGPDQLCEVMRYG